MGTRKVAAIAVLYHPAKAGAEELAAEVASSIPGIVARRGIAISLHQPDPAALRTCVMSIVIGGDGTILGAARLCAPLQIPILPVQMGRLGALAEIEAGELAELLPLYLHGHAYRDERLMLAAHADGHEVLALNDVVVARGASAGPIHVEVAFGSQHFGTVRADGLIVATPTGSTAYTYSAGGPIVHPSVPSLCLTAVAPQLGRPHLLVVPPDEVITLSVTTDAPPWVLTADGQLQAQLGSGTTVTICRAEYQTVFLRRGDPYHVQRRLRDFLTGNPLPGA